LLRAIVGLLLVANIINLGADLGAMGDALRLLIGGSSGIYVVLFAALCAALEIFSRYARYVKVLKWLTLSLFAYVATVLVVEVPWREVLYRTLVPSFIWQQDYIVVIVAVLGTTISPYLFFWQASEEAEDERVNPDEHPLTEAPEEARGQIRRIEIDTYIGMGLSNLIAFFIIITTAATLHLHGITDIQTSEEAARALRPIAGELAFSSLPAASSAPACWRSRCSPGRPPTPWPKRCNGPLDWAGARATPRHSTVRSRSRR
jgi:Mn2+/Fe2+ NRAMP family transporter